MRVALSHVDILRLIEMIRRGMAQIRTLRDEKAGPYVQASNAAWLQIEQEVQDAYLRVLRQHYKGLGVISRGTLVDSCVPPQAGVFGLQILNGTEWFSLGYSHGVTTVLDFVIGDEVELTIVGDVFSGDVYWWARYGPVWLVRASGHNICLSKLQRDLPLNEARILLARPIRDLSPEMCEVATLFGDYRLTSGMGTGATAAELWAGQCAGLITAAGQREWEPGIAAVNKRLGFKSFSFVDGVLVEDDPFTHWLNGQETLQIHRHALPQVEQHFTVRAVVR